jgi:acetyl esterase/lipase
VAELDGDTPVQEWMRNPVGRAVLVQVLEARGATVETLTQLGDMTLNQLASFSNGALTPDFIDRLVAQAAGAIPLDDAGPIFGAHDTPEALRSRVPDVVGVRALCDIEYAMVTGYRPLRMDLFIPSSDAAVPVVAYIHGGAFRMGSKRLGMVNEPIWEALLGAGFAVAAIEYRLSYEALFPACVNDAHAAVRWLRTYGEQLGIRPDAISAWGESAGAHIALFLGSRTRDERLLGNDGVTGVDSSVSAVVAWYPPTDFLRLTEQTGAQPGSGADSANSPESELIGVALRYDPELAAYASPITHITANSAPTLLVHGDADRLVPHQQSVSYCDALTAAGVSAELDLVPDGGHGFRGTDRAPLVARSVDFLRRH